MSDNESPIDWEKWVPGMRATLMFIRVGDEVLLIEKQRGIGAGKVNGPGGKIDPGETPLECAIRETQEELCVTATGVRKMGELFFAMSDMPDIHCHVYTADGYEGTPTETPEAIPLWCKVDEIPYSRMWDDDQYWLGEMLAGKTFRGRFVFQDEEIRWREVHFGMSWDEPGCSSGATEE